MIRVWLLLPAVLFAQGSASFQTTLERLFEKRDFATKPFGPARWVDGGAGYSTVEANEIVRYDTASGKREVLVGTAKLPSGTLASYEWSKDHQRLLVFTNTKKVWRQNTRGDYWVLDVPTGKLKKLGAAAPESSLMFAKFSPDGKRVAYVRANNIFVEDVESGAVKQLTKDGSETTINGTSDWVYEEEFNVRDGFRWSPDGRRIAYWQFDSAGVERFPLTNNTDTTYPVVKWIPYPKVGTRNSAARIGVVETAGGATKWMKIPGDERENYIARLDWAANATQVVVQHLNRLQNRNDVLLADARSGDVKEVFRDEDKAWVDVVDDFRWLGGGEEFTWLSERDGWRRAYVVSRGGSKVRAVTPAGVDVMRVVEMDAPGEWIYYLASPANATQRYLYRARLDGTGAAQRLTPASQPGSHSYVVSPDGKWAFHTWSSFDRPPLTDLVRLPSHEVVRILAANSEMRERVAGLQSRPVEFFTVDIGAGVKLDGWMLKPRDFDPSRKYPLLMHVYGEPAAVTVTDSWDSRNGIFHRALANEGYIVASVDNRGTPAPKGREWRKMIYGSVGVLSSSEQAAALRELLAARPYLDPSRVAVWGWSGGGSNTLNLMFRSPELYKVGMAVAPVPDQRLYDTIYQERYMGVPKDNPDGFRTGSPISFAEGLRGRLLLVHGTGDDNVHYQGLERLINRLIELGKPFDMMAYPNRSHSISEGKGTSLHVYRLLARYLMEHLPAGGR